MTATETLTIQPNVYYTLEEAAQLLRVSPEVMSDLLESGIVQGINVTEMWRVLGLALLDLTSHEHYSERALVEDWKKIASRTLQEVWDNEEDSVYDDL
jgi:hypothetical protein